MYGALGPFGGIKSAEHMWHPAFSQVPRNHFFTHKIAIGEDMILVKISIIIINNKSHN